MEDNERPQPVTAEYGAALQRAEELVESFGYPLKVQKVLMETFIIRGLERDDLLILKGKPIQSDEFEDEWGRAFEVLLFKDGDMVKIDVDKGSITGGEGSHGLR